VPASTPLFSDGECDSLQREIEPLGLDVIHFPFSLYPGRLAERVLLTIHDLTCSRFPEFIEARYLPFYRTSLQRAAEADCVIAVSHRVAAELVEAGLPPSKIHTCYPLTPFEDPFPGAASAVDRALLARLDGYTYILSVGSLEPRKNHLATLDAFARFRTFAKTPVHLVLVGWHGWLMGPLLDAVARHPYGREILVVTDAGDGTLRHLLRHCGLYVNLSQYEGFGLPVLEALAEGACVLSTPVPSLTESGFPSEGLLEATDPPSVARRLSHFMDNCATRQELAASGRSRVGNFYTSRDPARLAKMYSHGSVT
jgi:glycosyltransferase involved in cell wall biosynthesis